MSPSDSTPRRLAAAATVVVGLGLLGASAEGVLALDSKLKAATAPTIPTRLTEERAPAERDGRCHEPEFTAPRSPEV